MSNKSDKRFNELVASFSEKLGPIRDVMRFQPELKHFFELGIQEGKNHEQGKLLEGKCTKVESLSEKEILFTVKTNESVNMSNVLGVVVREKESK